MSAPLYHLQTIGSDGLLTRDPAVAPAEEAGVARAVRAPCADVGVVDRRSPDGVLGLPRVVFREELEPPLGAPPGLLEVVRRRS